jgi:tape measure domain-containing protein
MAGELERLLIRIEADTAILRKAMLDAEKRVAGFSSAVDKNLERSERRFRSFNNVSRQLFAGLSVGYLVKETAQLADTYTNMTNRLKFVTSSSAELEAVQRRLFQIAQETRVDLRETTELYARMSFALRDAGVSQNQVLQFTENLNKLFQLSGASAAEAAGALTQFSQGLAAGQLRGQELNSVMEQIPPLADLIAKKLGITTGELKKWGEQGKISGRVAFDAVYGATEELRAQFDKTVPTISQGFVAISNSLLSFIGRLNEASGAGETMARTLIKIAEQLDRIDASRAAQRFFGPGGAAAGAMAGALAGRDSALGVTTQGWEASITPAGMDTPGPNRQNTVDLFTETEKKLEQLRIQALEAQNFQTEALQAQHALELQNWQSMLDQKLISLEQFNQAQVNLQAVANRRQQDAQSRLSDALLSQVSATGAAIFGENKKWAMAEAAISTYQGIAKALGAFPPPFNFAMAALVAAQGFAQVAAIRSAGKGSSGGGAGVSSAGASGGAGSVGGGASSGGESSSATNRGRAIGITLVGRSFDREQVRELIEGLNEAIADGAVLRVA